MRKQPLLHRATLLLALPAVVMLLYSMLAIPLFKEQIFIQRGEMGSVGELLIFLGFFLYAIFNVVSVFWTLACIRTARHSAKNSFGLLVFGIICLPLLAGIKTMVDEISREYGLGWDVAAEWTILYVFLSLQLLYISMILRRLLCQPSRPLKIDRQTLGKA